MDTQTTSAPRKRTKQADTQEQTQEHSTESTETMNTHEGANGATPTGEASATPTVSVEIAGLNVTLPLKFRPGHVLTENQAKILDAAYVRQFTNNQNANAKNKTDALLKLAEKATDADRTKYAPLTAAALTALYADYEPAVGGTPRASSLETLRQTMAWKFWTTLVAEHNKSVSAGGTPVITKAGAKQVTIASAPRKGKDQSEADAKAARDVFDADRQVFIGRLLEHSVYGPQIQAMVDAELAAKAAEKSAPAAPSADTVVAEEVL